MDENFEYGDDTAIAIIGMACHLPGAQNISEFWQNLHDGIESIRFYKDEELLAAGESPAALADPNYVRAQPIFDNFDRFDAGFWGWSPQDAAVTDPAHRLFLQVAYESLEHAGHTGYDHEGRVGVFAGSGASLYWMNNLKSNPQLIEEMGEFLVRHTGNDMNFLATRLSYELDLRGPSINVQTACSSALVAVHLAAQSLLGGESDLAIAGGSTFLLPQKRGYIYKEGEIMSPDGHCRPFDAKSAGTIFGSGAGSVVLRRLEDAIEDGDTIHAIVRGSAINNDGAQKIGFLAPGVEGQAAAIAESLEISGVAVEDISYVEAHGTGTQVGDPIEFEALNQVFREATDQRGYCRLGSVKSNIGHLGEAAGAAAFIKVILALQNKQIPASLNFESPNPDMDLANSPFLVNDKLVAWESDGPRVAGITALGAGGTNVHVIVEQAPETEPTNTSKHAKQLLLISAKTPTALNIACRNLAKTLRQQPELNLADVAYTLQIGRRPYAYRRAIACKNHQEAIHLLEAGDQQRISDAKSEDRVPSLVFMFPGGGAQYAGMGAELYKTLEVYRTAFDACLDCLVTDLAEEIRSLVFASNELAEASKALERPSRTLPSLFATEYALAKQLQAWGAKPTAMVGHSLGEYTAACIAGVISLKDAMHLVLLRGKLFEKVPLGGMLSISLPEAEARKHLPTNIDIAASNAPDLCVASGPVDALEKLQTILEEKEVDCTRVRIDIAAHSSMLEPILEEFLAFCKTVHFSAPAIPYPSNLTGTWITEKQATDPNYWVEHLRNTIKFEENITTLLEDEPRILVEIGPGHTLTNLARAGTTQAGATFNSMRHAGEPDCDVEIALRTLGRIWANGVDVDWSIFWGGEHRQRVPLPTYPFEKKQYWIDPGEGAHNTLEQPEALKKRPTDDWFALYNWSQSGIPKLEEETDTHWLIFEDDVGVANLLVETLVNRGCTKSLTTVKIANEFARISDKCYQLNPDNLEHFEELLEILDNNNQSPQHIVYLWPVGEGPVEEEPVGEQPAIKKTSSLKLDIFEAQQAVCFWGLFNLAKVLGELEDPIKLSVVSSGLFSIGGGTSVNVMSPEKATLIGPVAVLPHEFAHVQTKSIDIQTSAKKGKLARTVRQLLRELNTGDEDRFVAYRGSDRWIRSIEAAYIEKPVSKDKQTWLKKGGTFVITGGLGGIGLAIANHLSQLGAGHLILISRAGLPDRSEWNNWLEQHEQQDSTSEKIHQVQNMESHGARVVIVAADVTDPICMKDALASATQSSGPINGVIHAAGVMDDHLVMLKSRESAQSVLGAKIKGALILDSLLPENSLDFFVVFSSVASYMGLPGQIDYSAANAFLDAFSRERSERATGKTLAINWNAWAGIGMAANTLRERAEGAASVEKTTAEKHISIHPAIDYYIQHETNSRLYHTAFCVDKHWLLSEHKIKGGGALIPGTGLIELLRATFADSCGSMASANCIELTDVQMLTAFQVPEATERVLHVRVDGDAGHSSMTVFSDTEDLPHVTGSARFVENKPLRAIDVTKISSRCSKSIASKAHFLDQVFMDFGPRWGCIKSIKSGKGEALMEIELPSQFISDLDHYKLHPALLDMATGGVQCLIEGFSATDDFYVPVAYEHILVLGPMPAVFYSHIRLSSGSAPGFARFDVTLVGLNGEPFVDICGFTMKKVEVGFMLEQASLDQTTHNQEQRDKANSQHLPARELDPLEEILREAILPEEGIEAFNRIMAQEDHAQWIVSSVDSELWLRQLDETSLENDLEETNQISYVKEVHHDPDADPDIQQIEDTIAKHAAVDRVIVRSHLDESGQRRLVAHFLPDDWEQVTVTELRKFCKAELAAELVPQQFIELDELPEDEQGRLDRTLLVDPFAPIDNYVAPSTSSEKKLAKIWQNTLGIDRISLVDNFFDIGGHSLVSIRVIVKVKKTLGVRLDQEKMVLLTLEQMAKYIDDQVVGNTKPSKQNIDSKQKQEIDTHSDHTSNNPSKGKRKSFIKSLFGRE